MSEYIAVERRGGVQIIQMNRPGKKNALTADMYQAMTDALAASDADESVRVNLIMGQPGVFTAGNDINDFVKFAAGGALGAEILAFLRRLVLSEKPMIAVVDGLAIGLGTTMLLHCDLVFATPGSTFKTPFLDLGVVPEAASSLLAPVMMGHPRAFEMLCLGNAFSGEDARRAGFVNRIVAPSEIESEALSAASAIAEKPPVALKMARDLLRGPREPVLRRIDEEAALFAERLRSAEALEAFAAFTEKRPPRFGE